MGIGAVIMLATLGVLAATKANFWLERDEPYTAVWVGLLFSLEVGVLVLGNPWVWLGWALLGAAKSLWLPSQELKRNMAVMPQSVHHFNVTMTVTVNGLLFALFQWLR